MDINQITTHICADSSKCKEDNAQSDLRTVKVRVEKGPLEIVPSFPEFDFS